MSRIAREAGPPYVAPTTPPTDIGVGLGFVIWTFRSSLIRSRWLSFHAWTGRPEVVVKRHEARGFAIVLVDAVPLMGREEQLARAWRWLHGNPQPRGTTGSHSQGRRASPLGDERGSEDSGLADRNAARDRPGTVGRG
jgi:hypothetical protein